MAASDGGFAGLEPAPAELRLGTTKATLAGIRLTASFESSRAADTTAGTGYDGAALRKATAQDALAGHL